jgi:predicted ATP-grasp superfamily ATP-dependent carboligase
VTARTVIVTDGDQRAALAVVRSLGGAGYRCVVAASSRRSVAGASRHAARNVMVPEPLDAPAEFTDAIATLARDEGAALVIPIAEPAMLALLPERARFGRTVIPFADAAAFRALSDKQRLLEEAATLGIAVPDQRVLANPACAEAFDVEGIRYPVVLKPARSVGEHAGQRTKLGVSYAASSQELRRKLQALPPAAFPLLLQQRIEGPGTGIFLLLWDGAVRARFAHRRRSEKPPSGGVSVYRESIAIDADLLERSRALLDRFSWRGPAMVEYKIDAASGQPYLMEVNGRLWGSLQLAIDAGVDFPRLLAACALGEHAEPVLSYRVGVRSRWWWGQVDHLIVRARQSGNATALPPGTLSAREAFGDLVFGPFRRADYEEVLRWSDPLPFWYETLRWLRGL